MDNKFKFFNFKSKNGSNTVVAVTTYAGKVVKGYAKCSPEDTFDLETGKKLAKARCYERVALKRKKRASQKLVEASEQLMRAQKHYEKMNKYFICSIKSHDESKELLKTTLEKV